MILYKISRNFSFRILYIFFFSSFIANAAEVSFSGNSLPVIKNSAPNTTGLDYIYIAYEMSGLSIIFNEPEGGEVEWYKYSNLGGGYSELINDIVKDGSDYILKNPEGDMGYLIKYGNKSFNFWIIDYSKNKFSVSNIDLAEDNDCGSTILNFYGNAKPLIYYSINGRQETLDRDIHLEYNNLEWNGEGMYYEEISEEKKLASIESIISIVPPLYCETSIYISGDKFLKEWRKEINFETTIIHPISVAVETEAIQTSSTIDNDEASNIIKGDSDGLGGSAPCDISFNSYVTDAVIHNEWQMAEDEEFENITYRFNERNLNYTFTEEGVTYVRFVGSNDNGSCEAFGDVYKIIIGSSELLIPNAFSPDGDGINDIWKVAYRSLLDFKCWIFNRNGHQVFYFEDPSQGWDGKRNGKTVDSGVYFYVIQATGSDGKKYKKSGDINIIKSKVFRGNTGSTDE